MSQNSGVYNTQKWCHFMGDDIWKQRDLDMCMKQAAV